MDAASSIASGRKLAQELSLEYLETVKARKPSHVEAMERIRARAEFKQTKLRGWIKKIGQTAKGSVELVFVVPYEQRAEALELVNSYGVPLDFYLRLMGEPEPDADE